MKKQTPRQKFDSSVRRFRRDQRGSTVVIFAVFLMAGVGFAAIAIDGGYLYSLKNKLQTTADAAVLVAVSELPDTDAARTAAIVMAGKNMAPGEHGAVLASADVVTGNWDSGTRTFTAGGTPLNAVRVVTRRSQVNGNAAGLFFASTLGFNQVDVETTAIASLPSDGACVVALDPSEDRALEVSGSAELTLGCGVQVNSTSSSAIRMNGKSCLTASSISIAGDYQGARCIYPTPDTGAAPIADPLADLVPPSYSGCNYTELVEVTTDTMLDPGVYCGGIYIHNSPVVQFDPGIYILDGRGLEITGSAVVTGAETMIYLAPTVTGMSFKPGSPPKSFRIGGGTQVTLSAPTSGPYEGVLLYQDRNTPTDFVNHFRGGAEMTLNGTLYFPSTTLDFGGNSESDGGATSIVARIVELSGTSYLGQDPSTQTFGAGGSGGISLVQ